MACLLRSVGSLFRWWPVPSLQSSGRRRTVARWLRLLQEDALLSLMQRVTMRICLQMQSHMCRLKTKLVMNFNLMLFELACACTHSRLTEWKYSMEVLSGLLDHCGLSGNAKVTEENPGLPQNGFYLTIGQ
mmetsp:Transcript_29557/g.71875  ORF Transcript_29557/g.71875 Transcript_29557/m.71875 type:complete len:131 (-) Transcript_29557:189-581(-)